MKLLGTVTLPKNSVCDKNKIKNKNRASIQEWAIDSQESPGGEAVQATKQACLLAGVRQTMAFVLSSCHMAFTLTQFYGNLCKLKLHIFSCSRSKLKSFAHTSLHVTSTYASKDQLRTRALPCLALSLKIGIQLYFSPDSLLGFSPLWFLLRIASLAP